MRGFVQGADRQQTTLFPECLDDWLDETAGFRGCALQLPVVLVRSHFCRLIKCGTKHKNTRGPKSPSDACLPEALNERAARLLHQIGQRRAIAQTAPFDASK